MASYIHHQATQEVPSPDYLWILGGTPVLFFSHVYSEGEETAGVHYRSYHLKVMDDLWPASLEPTPLFLHL